MGRERIGDAWAIASTARQRIPVSKETSPFPSSAFPSALLARAKSNPEDREGAIAAMGAALSAIHRAAVARVPGKGAWCDRLAIESAVTALGLEGRQATRETIRDAVCLCDPGGDPGPEGRVFLMLRANVRYSAGDRLDVLKTLITRAGIQVDDDLEALIVELEQMERASKPPPLLSLLAEVFRRCRDVRPDIGALPLLVADRFLARAIGSSRVVPVMGISFPRIWKRRGDLQEMCLRAILDSALEIHLSARRFAEASTYLQSAMDVVRNKSSKVVLDALLRDEAAAPRQFKHAMTDRSARRLFDRLEALEAVEELTGREALKVYGLKLRSVRLHDLEPEVL